MTVTVSTLINNAVFFGIALAILLVLSFILSRLAGRIIGLGLRAAGGDERFVLQAILVKRTRRVLLLLTTVLSLGVISSAVILSLQDVDIAPRAWTWFETSILRDPVGLAWLAGELLALALAALLLHRILHALVGLVVARLQGNPAFLRHHAQFELLLGRVRALLRWGMLLAALLAAAVLFAAPSALGDPLRAATYIVVGVLATRALVVVASLGVDITVQLVRALEGRRTPLRYLGRLEHLAGVTKRTLEYFCFVGAATLVVDQLRPDTWLSQSGLVAIRLIALIYVGRVVIEVFGLILREVLLADPDKRSESEHQQRLTLVPVATSILRYAVYFCMIVMGLQELGVDTSPILAGAGLLGLAVGLGAQTLVGDIVAGFFILFEGLFLVGDRIRVGEVVGSVEEIGIRLLKIRDEFGVLHCIPNGDVRAVANHARTYVNAVVEFSIPYDEDIPRILEHLHQHIAGMRHSHPDILSDTDFSVQDLMDTGALIRSLTRVKPSRDDSVGDIIRAELLTAMSSLGVMPSACYVVKLPPGAKARQTLAAPQLVGTHP